MSELKICPFCEEKYVLYLNTDAGGLYYVLCDNCGIESHNYKTEKDAIEAWNTRKPVERALERLEKASYWTPSTYDSDGYCNDDSDKVVSLEDAIEIIKEELG